jgi:hypothetical protein
MFFFRNHNSAGWRIAIGLRTLLISLFFFASHSQVFGPLGDHSSRNESRLVSPKEYIESAALSRGFKSDGGPGQETFLATAALHHVQVQRARVTPVNQDLGIHGPFLVGSFLIRSPPAEHTA